MEPPRLYRSGLFAISDLLGSLFKALRREISSLEALEVLRKNNFFYKRLTKITKKVYQKPKFYFFIMIIKTNNFRD